MRYLLISMLAVYGSFSKAQDKPELKSKKAAEDFAKHIHDAPSYATDPYKMGQVRSYDPEKANYQRFKDSPCFEKLSYTPYYPVEHPAEYKEQEEMYCECEREYYWGLAWKIGLGIIVAGAVGYRGYIFLKKERSNPASTKN